MIAGDGVDKNGCCTLCGGLVPQACPEPDGFECADRQRRSRLATVITIGARGCEADELGPEDGRF